MSRTCQCGMQMLIRGGLWEGDAEGDMAQEGESGRWLGISYRGVTAPEMSVSEKQNRR
ncbi:MAG: hypothetical protein ACKV0T_26495 [Planctomycetales bacterium]